MSVAAGKNDSESGLTFEIDASNPKSYPGSGTSIYDLSGNNVTGTLTNGPTYSSLHGGTITFDGSNDYISMPSSSNLLSFGTADFSISFWIYVNSTSSQTIFTNYNAYNSGFTNYLFIGYLNASGGIYILDSSGNTTSPTAVGCSISPNRWTQVTFTRTSTTYSCYKNGVFVNSQSDTDVSYTGTGRTILLGGGLADFGYFNGQIANLSVYSRALGASEVAQMFDSTKGQFVTSPTTDGLVLYLDAGTSLSYPGSGTTWYDLKSMSNNSTLVNGPTYSSNNWGYITFDGSNDYADFYAPNLTTTATVEMWVNLGAAFSGKMFMGWNAYDIYCAGGSIGYNTGNGDVYGISSATVSSLGCVGNWKQYIFEFRSDVSYTNNKIYVNTSSQSLSQISSSENAGARNFNSGLGRIALWRANTGYEMPMNCAIFRVYNKSLSSNEISQNFNAFRDRFNI
jgi:hypothetical protein